MHFKFSGRIDCVYLLVLHSVCLHVKHDLTGHDPSGSGSKCIDVYTSPSAVVGVEQEWGLKKKKKCSVILLLFSLFEGVCET